MSQLSSEVSTTETLLVVESKCSTTKSSQPAAETLHTPTAPPHPPFLKMFISQQQRLYSVVINIILLLSTPTSDYALFIPGVGCICRCNIYFLTVMWSQKMLLTNFDHTFYDPNMCFMRHVPAVIRKQWSYVLDFGLCKFKSVLFLNLFFCEHAVVHTVLDLCQSFISTSLPSPCATADKPDCWSCRFTPTLTVFPDCNTIV